MRLTSRTRMARRALGGTLALALMSFSSAGAQKALIVGAGAGLGRGERVTTEAVKGNAHGMAFIEAHLPLLPVGVRVDGMLLDAAKGGGPLIVTANGVVVLPVPIIQPYGLAGWGRYGVGRDVYTDGWNYGVGARLVAGPLRLFGEMRRHQRLSKDLITVGITM